jgi:hypothetical protein
MNMMIKYLFLASLIYTSLVRFDYSIKEMGSGWLHESELVWLSHVALSLSLSLMSHDACFC